MPRSRVTAPPEIYFRYGRATLYRGDCLSWLNQRKAHSVHAVVTDPPYGMVEYSPKEQRRMRNGDNTGVWRLPPSFDGYDRAPLPRFTTLTTKQTQALSDFFEEWATALIRVVVPGAHVFVATTPVVSFVTADALRRAGFERRGEIVRLVRTFRGGDRPKDAHDEYPDLSVIPRSMWEPWLLFRKPFDGRVRDNLKRWWTGALRRPEPDRPFVDVLASGRTTRAERAIAPHPTLKPQRFLRDLVWSALPLGKGVVLDPFAGSGSTLAAAEAVGARSIGVEISGTYCRLASKAVPALAELPG